MKRLCHLLILVAILFIPGFSWSHGNAAHVMGTVTTTHDDHIVVKTAKGESVSLAFQPETTFQKNGIHKKDARPQVGDRLVAEVTKKGLPQNRDWVATEITFATPKAKP